MEIRQPTAQATGKMMSDLRSNLARVTTSRLTPPITTAVLKSIAEMYFHLSAMRQISREQKQQRTNQMKGAATQLKILATPVRNPSIRAR